MDTMTDGSQLMIIQFSRSNIFQAMRIEAEQDLSANSVTKQNRHDGKYHKASNKWIEDKEYLITYIRYSRHTNSTSLY
jgi:hypothetical protein